MRRLQIIIWLVLSGLYISAADNAAAIWSSKVQPLIDVQCVKCHGPIQQKGGLELDTPEMAMKGGDDGAAVVPGHPEKSPLYRHLAPDGDPHMPPKKELSEADRQAFFDWISALASNAAPAIEAPSNAPMRTFGSITEAIDTCLSEGWSARHITPSAPVSDSIWCRRVYLDLAGRIPTAQELKAFLDAPSESRRPELMDRLLVSNEYTVHMRELWDVFLMGRPKRDAHESRRRDNGWWTFLETSFRTNRPWNETVHALLTGRARQPLDDGASWFLYERRNDHQAIAEAVAPVVYGTRIDCAQCHDHPLAREIKQSHYWGLVAAYNRSKNIDGGREVGESAIGGFVNFTNLKKESQPAIVTLLTGRVIAENRPGPDQKEEDADDKYLDPSAKIRVPRFSRREAFADAATQDNPLLARAFVNRAWSAFFGRGIVHPADEMNARNRPSHPELLDFLATDFASHGYDIRRLIRGMILSRAYGLGPTHSAPDAFAGALERPLTAEQLARSWRIAAGLSPDDDELRCRAISALPDVLPKDYNASFQQAQFLSHSTKLTALWKPEPGSTASRLAAISDKASTVHQAFLAVYSRLPDSEELAAAAGYLDGFPVGNRDEAIGGLLGALMTSAEFMTMP